MYQGVMGGRTILCMSMYLQRRRRVQIWWVICAVLLLAFFRWFVVFVLLAFQPVKEEEFRRSFKGAVFLRPGRYVLLPVLQGQETHSGRDTFHDTWGDGRPKLFYNTTVNWTVTVSDPARSSIPNVCLQLDVVHDSAPGSLNCPSSWMETSPLKQDFLLTFLVMSLLWQCRTY